MTHKITIWILTIPFLLFAASIVMIVYGAIFIRQPNMEREFAFNRAAAAYFDGDSPERMGRSDATFDETDDLDFITLRGLRPKPTATNLYIDI